MFLNFQENNGITPMCPGQRGQTRIILTRVLRICAYLSIIHVGYILENVRIYMRRNPAQEPYR